MTSHIQNLAEEGNTVVIELFNDLAIEIIEGFCRSFGLTRFWFTLVSGLLIEAAMATAAYDIHTNPRGPHGIEFLFFSTLVAATVVHFLLVRATREWDEIAGPVTPWTRWSPGVESLMVVCVCTTTALGFVFGALAAWLLYGAPGIPTIVVGCVLALVAAACFWVAWHYLATNMRLTSFRR